MKTWQLRHEHKEPEMIDKRWRLNQVIKVLGNISSSISSSHIKI